MISKVRSEGDDGHAKLSCCDKLRDITEELDSAKEQIAALEQQLSLGGCCEDLDADDCYNGELLYAENKETAL